MNAKKTSFLRHSFPMKKDPIIERNDPVHFTFSLFFQKVLWNLLAFHYKSNELRKSVLSISHLKRVAVYIFADKANEEFQKKKSTPFHLDANCYTPLKTLWSKPQCWWLLLRIRATHAGVEAVHAVARPSIQITFALAIQIWKYILHTQKYYITHAFMCFLSFLG